jgi:glutathione S-transferase
METSTNLPGMVTFPPSLDSELGRFLLEHYRVPYREEPHAFIFASLVTLWHGGTVIFPLLYGKGLRLAGPRAISEYFDARCSAELRLFPENQIEKQQLEHDWTRFNQDLAFTTARFAYYHLLPFREMMLRPLSAGAPQFEQSSVRYAYPVFAGLLRTLLGLNAQRAQESLDLARTIFDEVEKRTSDDRKFLFGERLTLSDLAFAVAAAPMVLPGKYGGPVPSFEQMPPAVQAAVTEMRARPAGAFALRLYEEQR